VEQENARLRKELESARKAAQKAVRNAEKRARSAEERASSAEKESSAAKEEAAAARKTADAIRADRDSLRQELSKAKEEIMRLTSEKVADQTVFVQLCKELIVDLRKICKVDELEVILEKDVADLIAAHAKSQGEAAQVLRALGLAKYLAEKGSEKLANLERKVEKDLKKATGAVIEEIARTNEGIELRQKKHDVIKPAFEEAAKALTPDSPVQQALKEIAEHPAAPKEDAEGESSGDGKKTAGRVVPGSKLSAPTVSPVYPQVWECPECHRINEANGSGEEFRLIGMFLRDLGDSLEKSCSETNYEGHVYQCLCGHCHTIFPDNIHRPHSIAPGCSYSSDLVIRSGSLVARGVPLNKVSKAITGVDLLQVGTDSVGRSIHRWGDFSSSEACGFGGMLLEEHRKTARLCPTIEVDETPVDVAQHNGKSQKKAPSVSKQAYIVSVTSAPGLDKPFRLFFPMDGRGSEAIGQILEPFEADRIVSDGYGVYDHLDELLGRPVTHAVCWVHLRRKVLKALNIETLAQVAKSQDGKEKIRKLIQGETTAATVYGIVLGLSKLYGWEGQVKRNALETYEAFLARVMENRKLHARPLVDAIDKLFKSLAAVFAQEKDGRWTSRSGSPFAEIAVYYMNQRNELRKFLDSPELPPDTNLCEQSIRPIAVYKKAAETKQSFEYLRSMANWLSLVETGEANGILNIPKWLNDFHVACYDYCYDEMLSRQSAEGSDSVHFHRIDADILESFDYTPWLAWNYARSDRNVAPDGKSK